MANTPMAPPFDEATQRYLEALLLAVPEDTPYIERRLISDEKWQKYAGDGNFRYSGRLREYEPDLSKLLENRRLVIVGEPGAGKSTVARVAARRFAMSQSPTNVPVFLSLRSFRGNLFQRLDGWLHFQDRRMNVCVGFRLSMRTR
jgi:predicted NACHT family NTPase